jgi:type IV pilus assembly protein PilQ
LEANRFPFSGQKIDLNFQNVEVRAVLQIIAEVAEKNLVVSDNVGGTITLRLKNVPWDQALDIILKSKNLDKRETGNVLMVGTVEEIKNRELIELESMKQVEEIAPLVTEFIQVDFRRASDLKERLENAKLISDRGYVVADDQTNVLMVRETSRQIEEIRRTLRRFDIEVAQILIEARIVEASTTFSRELGIRWGAGIAGSINGNAFNIGGGQGGGLLTGANAATGFLAQGNIPNTTMVDFGVSTNSSLAIGFAGSSALLAAEISALQSDGRASILSQPKVITNNGRPAMIASGQKIPYQKREDNTVTTEFEEVELKLEVTPQINPGDRVSLDIVINKDAVSGVAPNGELIIDTNSLETSISLRDGETVVLGGVFLTQERFTEDKTPLLGDLPVIGNLFKRKIDDKSKRELLIFITPTLVRESLVVQ